MASAAEGDEFAFARIVAQALAYMAGRTRGSVEEDQIAAAAVEATMRPAKAPTPALAELYRTLGEWDAVMTLSMEPGAPPVELPAGWTISRSRTAGNVRYSLAKAGNEA